MIRDDPAWAPLREYLSERDWESFASIPLIARGKPVGVLNAFFAPGQAMAPRTVEFLVAMADQAAIAVDYADAAARTRGTARGVRNGSGSPATCTTRSCSRSSRSACRPSRLRCSPGAVTRCPPRRWRGSPARSASLSRAVLADLRAMVHELRPSSPADLGGLEEAVRVLAESTVNRTGLTVSVVAGRGLDAVTGELAEDVYRIIAEALHNVVRHAARDDGRRSGSRSRGDRLTATVTDDGRGMRRGRPSRPTPRDAAAGYGLTTMRERAERWGGTVTVRPGRAAGTVVRVVVAVAAARGEPAGARRPAATVPVNRRLDRPVRVMIVDDHAVVRRGVRAYLEALDDMAVAAEAADGQDALDQLAAMAVHGAPARRDPARPADAADGRRAGRRADHQQVPGGARGDPDQLRRDGAGARGAGRRRRRLPAQGRGPRRGGRRDPRGRARRHLPRPGDRAPAHQGDQRAAQRPGRADRTGAGGARPCRATAGPTRRSPTSW